MRFKEFYTEAQSQLKLGDPNTPAPAGYKRWGIQGKVILAPTSMTGDQVSAAIEADPSILTQPAIPKAGQGASITPPPTATPKSTETLPPGYREFKLPNGNLAAVPQQLDDKQALDLIKRKRPDLLGPVAQSMAPKKPVRVTIPADLPALPAVDNRLMATAKKSADAYLGRAMTAKEWDHLLRATFAESGHNQQEDAYIMATILNRARNGGFGGSDVNRVLTSPNQFQSVSGVPGERTQSSHFLQGPPPESLTKILQAAAKYLKTIPKDIVNFTAASEKAYGKGTDPRFLKKLQKAGGKLIGKTVFGKLG